MTDAYGIEVHENIGFHSQIGSTFVPLNGGSDPIQDLKPFPPSWR